MNAELKTPIHMSRGVMVLRKATVVNLAYLHHEKDLNQDDETYQRGGTCGNTCNCPVRRRKNQEAL